MFLADLVRKIDLPMRLDFIGVSSYRDGTESTELVFTKELRLDVRDAMYCSSMTSSTPAKPSARSETESYSGKLTPVFALQAASTTSADRRLWEFNEFVIGYGLDHAEQHRNLPFIGVLNVSSEQ